MSISFGVLHFDGPVLLAEAGKVWKIGQEPSLRISWELVAPPEPWQPIGQLSDAQAPLAWVRLRGEGPNDRLEVEELGRREIDEAPDGRWRWRDVAEGPGLMILLLLPSEMTLAASDPAPAGAFLRDGRVAVYWMVTAEPGDVVEALFRVAPEPLLASDPREAVRRLLTAGVSAPSRPGVEIEPAVPVTTGDGPWDVAVSYVSEDADYVRRVTRQLCSAGVRVFDYVEHQAALWGKDLFAEVGQIYGEATYTLVFVSASYRKKPFVTTELRHALSRAMATGRPSVLPVRLDDTELAEIPPSTHYLDGRTIPPERLAESMLERIAREQPTVPTPALPSPDTSTPSDGGAERMRSGLEALSSADPLTFFPAVASLEPGPSVQEAVLNTPRYSPAHDRALQMLLARDPKASAEFLVGTIRHCPPTGPGWHRAGRASELFSPPLAGAALDELWRLACGAEPERKRHALVALGNLGELLSPSALRAEVLINRDYVQKALSYAVAGAAASYLVQTWTWAITEGGRSVRELLDWHRDDLPNVWPKPIPDLRSVGATHYDELIEGWVGGRPYHIEVGLTALSQRAVSRAVPAIAELLETADDDTRVSAARALGILGGPEAAGRLLAVPPSDGARQHLVHVLHELTDDGFETVVHYFAESRDDWQQLWLVRSIGLRRSMGRADLVRRGLTATRPAVRGAAVLAASRLGLDMDYRRFVSEATPGLERAMGLAALVGSNPPSYREFEPQLRISLVEGVTGSVPARFIEDIFRSIGASPDSSQLIAAWRPVTDCWGGRI